ncbi:MAG: site-2 protease family protein, partial [Planctomycetota bacterium]
MAEWNDGPQYRQQHPLQWVNRMLDWALDCGRPVANIRLRVHWSVLIMPVLFAMQFKDANFGQFLVLVLMDAVIIFGSIYLHELGHALTAMRLGYPVRDIKLYILGGLANISYAPTNANHDFAIIAFGPMVNFVLVGMSSLFVWLLVPLTGLTIDNGYYLDYR